MSALAVVMMLGAYFPYLTYTIPAFAGLCIMVVLLELGAKWAISAYITSAVLTLLFCEPEAMLMYVFLFGYYPILKAFIEKINKPFLEWPVKMLFFNAVVILVYSFITQLFGVDFSNDFSLGKYTVYIVLAVGNAVFVVYDITVSKMATFYFYIIKPKLRKFFK